MSHPCLAFAAATLAVVAVSAPAVAGPSCFATCMTDHKPTTDDYFAFADDVKACRDRCDASALESFKKSGLYTAYAACTPVDLDREAFKTLRSSNPSWQAAFNVFLWEVTNPLEDVVLTEIEVVTQDMNLINVSLTAATVIAPGESGTFVIPDFFDGYPAVRYATKVTGAKGCKIS